MVAIAQHSKSEHIGGWNTGNGTPSSSLFSYSPEVEPEVEMWKEDLTPFSTPRACHLLLATPTTSLFTVDGAMLRKSLLQSTHWRSTICS